MARVAEFVELPGAHPRAPDVAAEISFLERFDVPRSLLLEATERAKAHGTPPHRELLALGFGRHRYWSTLAADLGIEYLPDLSRATVHSEFGQLSVEAVRNAPAILVRLDGRVMLVAAPRAHDAARIRGSMAVSPGLGSGLAVAAPETISAFIARHRNPALLHYAINRLAHVLPSTPRAGSASGVVWRDAWRSWPPYSRQGSWRPR